MDKWRKVTPSTHASLFSLLNVTKPISTLTSLHSKANCFVSYSVVTTCWSVTCICNFRGWGKNERVASLVGKIRWYDFDNLKNQLANLPEAYGCSFSRCESPHFNKGPRENDPGWWQTGWAMEYQQCIRWHFSIPASIYLSMYLCMYVCMYVCMHVCMYVCIIYLFFYLSIHLILV